MMTNLISLQVRQDTYVRVGGHSNDTLQATLQIDYWARCALASLLPNDVGRRLGYRAHPAGWDRRYHKHFIRSDLV